MKKKNWIELERLIGDFSEADGELWIATCHHDGHITPGYCLAGPDEADFFETDPRELSEDELVDGYRLPAYMPGYAPEEA